MKVLLTGAFGNLGTSCIIELAEQGYEIRCFDIRNKMTELRSTIYKKKYSFEIFWGNLEDKNSIKEAMNGINAIIHTAAIIPPVSDTKPDLANRINVEGTKNLIEEAEKQGVKQFIFSSSVSVHGIHYPSMPQIKVTDPFKPFDTYNNTKVQCEGLLRDSKLKWTIVRFGAILPVENRGQPGAKFDDYTMEMTFGIPLDQKVEIIHSRDAALALVNAINNDQAYNQIFFGGGGSECQLYERDFIFDMLKSMGVGKLPENVFKVPASLTEEEGWFYTHWMDTEKSQEVLHYQRKDFEDYKKDMPKPPLVQKIVLLFAGPFVKRSLAKKSPYKH